MLEILSSGVYKRPICKFIREFFIGYLYLSESSDKIGKRYPSEKYEKLFLSEEKAKKWVEDMILKKRKEGVLF